MYLVEFLKIKKSYGRRTILNDFSLKVKEGEIFGLIGRSGSGKSILLKVLVGMTDVDKGKILFNGKNALDNINLLRKNTGFATQESMLIDELSIWENSYYYGKLYSMPKSKIVSRFKDLIYLLDLAGFERYSIRQLSGGMQKRANLLVSLIHNPKLLILDEPTTGLDSILRKSLWEYIHEINKNGTTIFVTSHLLDEIEQNCDTIGILDRGEIVTVGTMAQYKEYFSEKGSLDNIFEEVLE